MILTETEKQVLKFLRYPFVRMQAKYSPLNDLSKEEIISLYNKMDEIIEEEGRVRRSLGSIDEMYVLELFDVKNFLLQEINNRK